MVRSLPEPLRKRLGNVVAWSDQRRSAPPIEDWSTPLVGTRPGLDTPADLLITMTSASGGGAAESMLSREAIGLVDGRPRGTGPSHGGPALRCLIVTSRLDVGGIEEVVTFLARRLPPWGLHTAVLHATSEPSADGEPSGRLGRELRSSGIEVYEADRRGGIDWIERWCPDVISAHGAPDWVFAVAGRCGIPYVDNLHGLPRLFGADWTWHEGAARDTKLSAVVAVSDLVRQQYLASNRDLPADRVVLIPNGVDDERRLGGDRQAVRRRLGLTGEYLFVSLARHCLQKNSYGLVTAFGEFAQKYPEAHLVIAGRPDDIRYYRQVLRLRDSLSCRERIHLRDHVSAPAELLAAADGFVLDSFFEGWSLASMEALFAGVPVVLSDVGGAREQIGDDPSRGCLVSNPLGDPLSVDWESVGATRYRMQPNRDELVAAMERLVDDREYYLSGREHLAAESAARFSAHSCLERHAAVLHAVVNGTTLPATVPYELRSAMFGRQRSGSAAKSSTCSKHAS